MAELQHCPVCQGIVSSEAPLCPHCGHPLEQAKRQDSEAPSPSAEVPSLEGEAKHPRPTGGLCGCIALLLVGLGFIAFIYWTMFNMSPG